MKKFLIIVLSIFIFSNFLAFININKALAYDFEKESGLEKAGKETGHITENGENGLWFQDKTPQEIIGKVIGAILAFLGVVFLILMIYGGYLWMTARGNEQGVEKAKDIIKNALIGLIIVLAAYAVIWTVYRYLPN